MGRQGGRRRLGAGAGLRRCSLALGMSAFVGSLRWLRGVRQRQCTAREKACQAEGKGGLTPRPPLLRKGALERGNTATVTAMRQRLAVGGPLLQRRRQRRKAKARDSEIAPTRNRDVCRLHRRTLPLVARGGRPLRGLTATPRPRAATLKGAKMCVTTSALLHATLCAGGGPTVSRSCAAPCGGSKARAGPNPGACAPG